MTTPFYRLPYQQRRDQLAQASQLTAAQVATLAQHRQSADEELIENYLTTYGLPEGVAVNLRVDGRSVAVPMVTEEPSVIAAASNGGRLLTSATGITTTVARRELMGQIVCQHVPDGERLTRWVADHQAELLAVADAAHPTLLQHGGGARSIRGRLLPPDWASIDLFVDVGEAMGANRTLARMNRQQQKILHVENIHGYRLTTDQVFRTFQRLLEVPLAERKRISGLEPERADIILGGMLPLVTLLQMLDSDRVVFSESGVREGIISEYLSQH